MKFGSAWARANFELIEKTTEIASGIQLIALVSDKPTTLELRELSLAIDTPDGIVLVVGCSHPGIEKIVEAASSIDKRIYIIAGGFHLVVANDPEIEKVVMGLRDTWSGLCGARPLHGRAHLRRTEKSVRPALRVCGAGEYDRTRPHAALDC
jgi:7,8-dihydropterin-6-yl-methyl-4-(beta-D-ribofuranosyl)aminobenzene 5'-phosphate synthase